MDYNEFSWERQQSSLSSRSLSADDIRTLCRLMVELRDLTLSRSTYSTATDFLKRLGFDVGDVALVRPEHVPR